MPLLNHVWILIIGLTISSLGFAQEQAVSTEEEAVKALIWEREMAIFEGRSAGDISNYLNATSAFYLGWPPGFAEPLPLSEFKAGADIAKGLKGEVTDVTKMGFTLNGNTALTYFKTHRTRLGEAFAVDGAHDVDQWYENIHVWTLEDGDWRLIGGMARPSAPPAED
ncbi:MAG: hypothetical protein ACI87W_001401 [Halieaceae bacterium]|jgi:hypothetical protein